MEQAPNNLRMRNGELHTLDGQPMKHYLNSVFPSYIDEGAIPMVLITKRYFEELVRNSEELKRMRKGARR